MKKWNVFYRVNTLRVSKGKPPEVVFSSIFDSFRDVDNHLAQYVIEKLRMDPSAFFLSKRTIYQI